MKGLLVRVGIDSTDGHWNGPVRSKTGEFAFVTITEEAPLRPGMATPYDQFVPVVQRLARLDPEATVRREAIRVLVRWKDQVSSARETLVWVSKNDPEDDLRAVALEGLSRPA